MRISDRRTRDVLRKFYYECVDFWLEKEKSMQEAQELAFHDCSKLKTDPYSNNADELDMSARSEVLLSLRIFG